MELRLKHLNTSSKNGIENFKMIDIDIFFTCNNTCNIAVSWTECIYYILNIYIKYKRILF